MTARNQELHDQVLDVPGLIADTYSYLQDIDAAIGARTKGRLVVSENWLRMPGLCNDQDPETCRIRSYNTLIDASDRMQNVLVGLQKKDPGFVGLTLSKNTLVDGLQKLIYDKMPTENFFLVVDDFDRAARHATAPAAADDAAPFTLVKRIVAEVPEAPISKSSRLRDYGFTAAAALVTGFAPLPVFISFSSRGDLEACALLSAGAYALGAALEACRGPHSTIRAVVHKIFDPY